MKLVEENLEIFRKLLLLERPWDSQNFQPFVTAVGSFLEIGSYIHTMANGYAYVLNLKFSNINTHAEMNRFQQHEKMLFFRFGILLLLLLC